MRAVSGGHLTAFVVEDDYVAGVFHVTGAPPVPHFQPVGHIHYRGVTPTDLWVYRQVG